MTETQKKKLIKLRCKAWGITEDEYYCNQCSDFSLEDMARAYRRGKNKGRADLEKENADLKCECRRCVYTDSPCILSDYGKDRNGICDHFKDVFDENAELKAENDARKFAMAMSEKVEKQLREENKKAEEIIKGLLSFVDSLGNYSGGIFAKAEQFINSEVKK